MKPCADKDTVITVAHKKGVLAKLPMTTRSRSRKRKH